MKKLLACVLLLAWSNTGQAQNLRTMTRSTAVTGTNDSALVLVNDSAFRTRAISTHELFKRPNGSAAKPSYSFALDSTTGFRGLTGIVGTISGSVEYGRLGTQWLAPNGSAANPGLALYSNATLGLFLFGPDTLGVSVGGKRAAIVTKDSSLTVYGVVRVLFPSGGATPALQLGNNATGFGQRNDTISVFQNGGYRWRFNPGGSTLEAIGAATITGGTGNMVIQSGTGNSRTMTLKTTNNSGTVRDALLLSSDTVLAQSSSGLYAWSGCRNCGWVYNGSQGTVSGYFNGTEQLRFQTSFWPVTTNVSDLGTASLRFKRLYLADTLNTSGKMRATALTAASGTPNSVCMDATTKEITENAATSCVVSSLRYKKNVRSLLPSVALREAMALRPVTFNYKDGNRAAIGLIAEHTDTVDTRLVTRNSKGQVNAVNYEQVTILLLSVVQQQQKQIDSLRAAVAAIKKP